MTLTLKAQKQTSPFELDHDNKLIWPICLNNLIRYSHHPISHINPMIIIPHPFNWMGKQPPANNSELIPH